MRQGRLRPGQAGDVERERLGPTRAHQPFEPERELRLGDARTDLRQERREGPIGDGTRRGDPFQFCGLLDRSIGLEPALDRHELDVRGGCRQPLPCGMRHEPGLDADAAGTDRPGELRPAVGQVAVGLEEARVRCLTPGLDRVARIGQDHQLVLRDEELPGVPGGLLLALRERESRQVAHVLASDAEVGIDTGVGEPSAQAAESGRSRQTIGLGPGVPLRRVGWLGEILGAWPYAPCRRHQV